MFQLQKTVGYPRRDLRFSRELELKILKTKLPTIAPPIAVTVSFIVSRLLYVRAGLHFDNTPPKYFYQFIDPLLLRTRFLESIWNLHSQPPLLNFVTGLLYQRFSPQSKIYQLLFLALGLLLALVFYWLGLRLGLKPWVSAVLAIWFTISPATVLYENFYFYAYPTALLLVFAALTISKFVETDNFWWGLGFCSCLAALCLTWAIFHLLWMLIVIVLVAVFYHNWRKLVMVSLIPVLLVVGWYAKNSVVFGTFGASSWMGMNLSHITFLSPLTSQPVRDELVSQGKLTPYPVAEAFRPIADYHGLVSTPPPRGIPVLDENIKSTKAINFNHTFYIELSDRMLKDAINFIGVRPDLYLASVKQGFLIYFHSSSDYLLLKDKPTPKIESLWDHLFYGQLSDYKENLDNRWKSDPRYVGWLLVIVYLAAMLYGMKTVFSQEKSNYVFITVVAFITFTIIYFTLMANFFDLGENNRFRFTIDPLVFLLFVVMLQNLALRLRSTRRLV
jgi:hypothetical protein